ncbi:MAG TPA: transposase [Acidimicrobiia bacterium]|nr:transposase [Acidimicrobiia bacterium]
MSRICAGLDESVDAFRNRRLDHIEFPYVFVDATYVHCRENHQVVSKAVVIATGVASDGSREVLGCAVGDSESEAFWTEFGRHLRSRGLAGVLLVISEETRRAGHSYRPGVSRSITSAVPKDRRDIVAAAFRTIFVQATAADLDLQWETVRDSLAGAHPKAAALMDAAKTEVLAFWAFPKAHWSKVWSTNPLASINTPYMRVPARHHRLVGCPS